MIEELVTYVFRKIGKSWKVGQGYIIPDEDDVRRVLDNAAAVLYDRPTGTNYEQGGIHIEKHPTGLSVYVYVGEYT